MTWGRGILNCRLFRSWEAKVELYESNAATRVTWTKGRFYCENFGHTVLYLYHITFLVYNF